MSKEPKLQSFVIPLTEEQKAKYTAKRKLEGKTSQGCMRELILRYISEGVGNDKHPDP